MIAGDNTAAVSQLLHSALNDSVARNQALPAEFYTSPELFELELSKLFRTGWMCLGRTDEVKAVGDYFTASLLGEPVIVVRSAPDHIDVLANVCRHRGMPVAEGRGNTRKFRCSYHAWTYNLDGSLRNAPLMMKVVRKKSADATSEDKPLSHCRLPSIQSFNWGGFIFASLGHTSAGTNTTDTEAGSMQSEPVVPDLSELNEDIGAYHMQDMALIAVFDEVWHCNWKSLVENFMDAYHLSVVHPDTLRSLTPTNLCRKLSASKHHTSYIANYTESAPPRENHHPDLSAEQCRQSRLFCIYPSLMASVSADTLAFFMLQPLGLGEVSVKWGLASYEQDLTDDEKQQRIDKWRAINDEDHAILQRLQAGLRSSYYQGGMLAPDHFEGCVSDFHRALVTALLR
jgi:phenylpropionate dioxygenase-like ring-hydroxylating dioxygenase large terminal subunit